MDKLQSFEEFWPYYVGEHQKRACRAWHYLGSTLAILNVVTAIVYLSPYNILGALVCGYGPAWIGHFFVEHNRPATFTYPRWSLIADFKMYGLALTGKMHKEVELQRANGFKFKPSASAAVAA